MSYWRHFMRKYAGWLKQRRANKVEWLVRKWRKEDIVPDEVRGIVLKDTELENEFNSEPREYGGVEVTEKMKSILKLPTKHGVYGRVTEVATVISMEEAINKMRWKRSFEKEKDKGEGTEASFIFPRNDQKIVDITGLRPSMLPYNNKVILYRVRQGNII